MFEFSKNVATALSGDYSGVKNETKDGQWQTGRRCASKSGSDSSSTHSPIDPSSLQPTHDASLPQTVSNSARLLQNTPQTSAVMDWIALYTW